MMKFVVRNVDVGDNEFIVLYFFNVCVIGVLEKLVEGLYCVFFVQFLYVILLQLIDDLGIFKKVFEEFGDKKWYLFKFFEFLWDVLEILKFKCIIIFLDVLDECSEQ